jgi:type IX secretion system PorP/SprF family membrane protein
MKKTLATLAFCSTLLFAYAQQDAQFSMNMFNRLAVNPAYAGMNKMLCVTSLGRQQWVGLDGAPKTGLISVDYGRIWGGGIGLTIDQDAAGAQKMLEAKLAYSYHKVLNIGVIGIGINAGMFQSSLNPGNNPGNAGFIAPNGGTSINGGVGSNGLYDSKVPWGGTSATTYDVGFGVYYQTRKLYAGLSSSHLPQQTITGSGTVTFNGSTTDWDSKYTAARHYYVMAGYTFTSIRDWEITPSIFAKSVIASTQLDVNLIAKWRKMLFAGAGYRLNDAVIVMGGIEQKFSRQLTAKLGGAYDVPASGLRSYNNGSWEFMLGFCYKIIPEAGTQSHMNVRFL